MNKEDFQGHRANREGELREESDEQSVRRDGAQITGRTDGPYASDGTDMDRALKDNKNRDVIEDSANGLDSVQERGGQDGRNIRGFGGIDMDSKNGVIRFNDINFNMADDITEEGLNQVPKSDTSTVSVTTHGPDDYASDSDVPVPNAQERAKEQDTDEGTDANDSSTNSTESKEKQSEDIGRTGTSTTHQPAY